MPISKIQLKGITRIPSDRLLEDGGCAESLNVQVNGTELSGVPAPVDITADKSLPTTLCYDILFEHRHGDTVSFICEYNSQIGIWASASSTSLTSFFTLATGETFVDISAIGNTLVILTSTQTHYVLYKESAYHYLGTKVPEPSVDFRTVRRQGSGHGGWKRGEGLLVTGISTAGAGTLFSDDQEDYYSGYYADHYDLRDSISIGGGSTFNVADAIDAVSQRVWGILNGLIYAARNDGNFSKPVLVRYAVRLYDNSCIYASAPIMLGAGLDDYYYGITGSSSGSTRTLTITLGNEYSVTRGVKGAFAGWEDIVKSVDIFQSTEIDLTPSNSPIATCDSSTHRYRFKTKESSLKDEILSKVSFNLLESIPVEDITSSFPAAYTALAPVAPDILLAKETMPYDYRSLNTPQPLNGVLDYNSRIIGIGAREIATRGHGDFQAVMRGNHDTVATEETFKFRYLLSSDDGRGHSAIAHTFADSDSFPTSAIVQSTGDAYGFMMYPDSRCNEVEVYVTSAAKTYKVPMKPHPGLDCAYAIADSLTTTLASFVATFPNDSTAISGEDRTIETDNVIIQSPANNPFKFDVEGWHAFGAKVIDAATTTKALSQGQFGSFPLYVFTEGGIEALSTGNDGSFVAHSPVSRDVALPGTITPIDQAIVYITKKGVMLMSGSDIQDISRTMIDKPYAIENSARTLLNVTGSKWSPLASDLPRSPKDFLDFMARARAIYDYINRRLIFFLPDALWAYSATERQYVYVLDSGTWHTMTLFGNLRNIGGFQVYFSNKIIRALNSYPETHAQVNLSGDNTNTRLFNFGAMLAEGTRNPLAFIATGPIDFEQPDIYKTINRIRVRGNYPNERTVSSVTSKTVQYILLGSNDGVTFTLLHSLRGPSWKYFRILIAADTYGFDRISYIEVEWEPRFTDRIR